MRLVWVEIRRLFARRFFSVGVLTLLAGLAGILVLTAVQTPTSADWSKARATAAADATGVGAERERCAQAQRAGGDSDAKYPAGFDCADIVAQPAASYLEKPPFVLTEELGGRTLGLSAVLMLFAFLVGATAIGAEWHHGTLTGLLLWEPRRIRVFMAKLIALFTGVTLVSVVAYASQYGGLWLVARFRGMFGDFTPEVLATTGLDAARGLALALVAGALGFAIAFTLRHTAAAMGAALAYFAVFELGVRSFFPPAPKYLPLTYISAWLEKRAEVTYADCSSSACGPKQFAVEMWGGGAYVLGLGLVALGIAAVVFRRREVA